MAATMHAKMNRKQLSKLDIIKICEEILNPSVPMALRLSGILMGGVVIVYERKVKLLYDDVNRLLVEINEAWKVKSAPDPTVLPKRRLQAKKEAITLPDNPDEDVEEAEKSVNYSDGTAVFMGFQHTAYFEMRLDTLEEPCEERDEEQIHQADAADITLPEPFDTFQSDRNSSRNYERFDIEGDEDTHVNFPSDAHIPAATARSPSPPKMPPEETEATNQQGNNIHRRRDKSNRDHQEEQRREYQSKRNAKRKATFVMDFEQTIISGPTYQSWLQDSADIVSRQRRKIKGPMSSVKIAHLLELPPLVLGCDLLQDDRSIYYPAPLMELWRKSTQPPHDSPSGGTSEQPPPPPSSTSPPNRVYSEDRNAYDFQSGMEDPSRGESTEKPRFDKVQGMSAEKFAELFGNHPINDGETANVLDPNAKPGNFGDDVRSIPSSDSGHNIISESSGANSGRSNKMHRFSSSGNSNNGLETVAEETSWLNVDLNLKLSRLSENGQTPNQELLVETGPTQTPFPIKSPPFDKLTETIHSQMKAHFDSPGGPPSESLNHLTTGMNRKGAAMLFYQTCVLATRDILKVEQRVPYGDILISRGAKM